MKTHMIVRSILVLLVLSVCLSVAAFAARATVTITSTQNSASSASIGTSKSISYYASNYSSSTRKLYADIYYSSDDSSWTVYKSNLLAVGGTVSNTASVSGSSYWKIKLDPKGLWTTGCNGYGYVSY